MAHLTESEIESAALAWLEALGYTILSGPEIAPGEPAAEPACAPHADRREDYEQVILESRLRQALQRLIPQVPADALIAGELASKARRELVWSRNLVLLGDFNIFSPQDPTLAKLEEKGFLVPDKLKSLPSNASRNRHYDQIAFFRNGDFELTGNAGVFDYYRAVFRDQDQENFRQDMGERYEVTSSGKKRDQKSKRRFYRTCWRTYQMSDHFPMWVEVETGW